MNWTHRPALKRWTSEVRAKADFAHYNSSAKDIRPATWVYTIQERKHWLHKDRSEFSVVRNVETNRNGVAIPIGTFYTLDNAMAAAAKDAGHLKKLF